ncbi:MAG: hypothetical protein RL238_2485 [Actinomycetota bacterium]|jgi:pimeloyl-ACP methyl ester carboxylesterase
MLRRSLLVVALLGLVACSDTDDATPTAPTTDATVVTDSTAATGGDVTRHTFTTADGTEIEYVLLVPEGRVPGEPGKVLFAFPPGGQDIDLAERIVTDRYRAAALERGYVVVSPAAPSTGLFFTDASAALVPELLDAIATEYPPDDGRFDLMGVSNGGLSAFVAAIAMPERFRSLVVFPGNSPDGGDDPALANLDTLGVAMFVGANDTGWLEDARATKATLEDLGITVELTEVSGEGHIIESLTGDDLFDAVERVRT